LTKLTKLTMIGGGESQKQAKIRQSNNGRQRRIVCVLYGIVKALFRKRQESLV